MKHPTCGNWPKRGCGERPDGDGKEFKRGLAADRLSDHRYPANFVRPLLHASALNLLVPLSSNWPYRNHSADISEVALGNPLPSG